MRVLLLNPPATDGRRHVREARCTHRVTLWGTAWPPYTLAMIGGRARRAGHEVLLLDAAAGDVTAGDLAGHVSNFRPDAAVLSVSAPTCAMDLQAVGTLRTACPDCRVAVLGVHPTAAPAYYLGGPVHADCAIRGEPELTCEQLLAALDGSTDIPLLPGLSLRSGDEVCHGPDRPCEPDLSRLGEPDWSLASPKRYRLPFLRRPFLLVLASRGCPHPCSFCTQHLYYGRAPRLRDPGEIAQEVARCRRDFGVRDFFLWSECFALDRDHALRVCEALEGLGGVSWMATTRVDRVDPVLLAAMRRGGCRLVAFGLESGDQGILDACAKGHTTEQALEAVRRAREAGLMTVGHFILGLPGETLDSARNTLRFAVRSRVDFAQFYCAAPYPGTALHRGWVASEAWPGSASDLISQDSAVMDTDALTARQVTSLRRRAYARFYARPRPLLTAARLMAGGGRHG